MINIKKTAWQMILNMGHIKKIGPNEEKPSVGK
jgi:hypothetical protein